MNRHTRSAQRSSCVPLRGPIGTEQRRRVGCSTRGGPPQSHARRRPMFKFRIPLVIVLLMGPIAVGCGEDGTRPRRARPAARGARPPDQDDLDARSGPRDRTLHVLPGARRGPRRQPAGDPVHAGQPPRAAVQDAVHGDPDHDHRRQRPSTRRGCSTAARTAPRRLGGRRRRGRRAVGRRPARRRRPAERHRVQDRRQQPAARQHPLSERERQAARRRGVHQPLHHPARAGDPGGGDLLLLQSLHLRPGRTPPAWRARSARSARTSRW